LTKLADYIIQRVVAHTRVSLVGQTAWIQGAGLRREGFFHCKKQLQQPSRLGWEGFFPGYWAFLEPTAFSLQVPRPASQIKL
jgi:hypothetical protein